MKRLPVEYLPLHHVDRLSTERAVAVDRRRALHAMRPMPGQSHMYDTLKDGLAATGGPFEILPVLLNTKSRHFTDEPFRVRSGMVRFNVWLDDHSRLLGRRHRRFSRDRLHHRLDL